MKISTAYFLCSALMALVAFLPPIDVINFTLGFVAGMNLAFGLTEKRAGR